MNQKQRSRVVNVIRYVVLAVFFLLALGLLSVSYIASLAVVLGIVLGIVLAWPIRAFWASISIWHIIYILICLLCIIMYNIQFLFQFPTPPPPPTIAEYRVTIEPLDTTTFIVQEEILIGRVKEEDFIYEEKLLTSPKKEAKSTSYGLILRELHIKPWNISPTTTLSKEMEVSKPFCVFGRCPKSTVELQDFPKGSFYLAKDTRNTETSSYIDTETIRWSVRDLDKGITFAYIPAPYHYLRPFLIPFIEIVSFSPWLIGFLGFIITLFIILITIPHISDHKLLSWFKMGGKEGTAKVSAEFDLLSQATCAVLVNGEVAGTAWLASHEGHLITAGHLLGEDEPLSQVEVQFKGDSPRIARQIQWKFQKEMGIDFAVLKLKESDVHYKPLPISLAESVSGQCRLVGYGQTESRHHFGHRSTLNTKIRAKSSSKGQDKVSSYVGHEILSFEERAKLVDHLLAIPSIVDRNSRATVIDQLPPEIKTNVAYSSVDKTYIFNIVETCLQYPNGMQELRDILEYFEHDSLSMQQFKETLNRLLPRGLGFGSGEFVEPLDRQDSSANRLFCLRSPELVEKGYSGGAVFSDSLEAVVAIQTTRTKIGAGRDTVLAMPLYRVARHWEPLIDLAIK